MGLDQADPRPPYAQIADLLRHAIQTGTYQPGDYLPSARELGTQYQVAPGTVRAAISVLRDAGLVTSWQGKGVIVRGRTEDTPPPSPEFTAITSALEQLAQRVEDMEARLDEAGIPPVPAAPQPGPAGQPG